MRNFQEILVREKKRQEIIGKLHQLFRPRPGQVIMGRQNFSRNTTRNWFQYGRDSGKSFGGAYCKIRYCATHPKSYGISVFPERSQGQKTLWDSGYLHDKIPREFWLNGKEEDTFNKTELLIKLENGSRMQIFGADSPDTTLRGPKPDFCNFDEFRDFRPGVYDVMEANLIGKVLNILSTPPDQEGEYTELLEMFKGEIKAGNPEFFFAEIPTFEACEDYAPGGSKHAALMRIKARLIKRGELALWRREYEAKFVPGGVGAVFKVYRTNKRHIERDPKFLAQLLKGVWNSLGLYCICDPSQNGTFAVLYVVHDRAAGRMIIMGEEAVNDNAETGSLMMWDRMKKGCGKIYPSLLRWKFYYDEAAAWFYNDLERHGVFTENPDLTFEPTQKSLIDKNEQMSFIKDIFAERGRVLISRECEQCIKQIENYVTNKKGEYHKDQPDDFIDCFRYFLQASNFEPFEVSEEEIQDDLEPEGLEARVRARESAEKALTGDMDYPEGSPDDGGEDDYPFEDSEYY